MARLKENEVCERRSGNAPRFSKQNAVSAEKIQQQNKQPIIFPEPSAKIISCEVKGGKLITQLDDGREIIMAVSLLTKWGVLNKEVKPEQLAKWELQNEGRYIYFPEIDDILPVRIISEGLFKSCWEK